jgi:hypothetical protein
MSLEEIKELARSGIITDGSHHKQWYLEEILKIIDEKMLLAIKEEYGIWIEESIPP